MTVLPNRPLRVASVIPSLVSGGIGPVCAYAARSLASRTQWDVTLACLHDSDSSRGEEEVNGSYRQVNLGLEEDCARGFHRWLQQNPQDLVITSDVSHIQPAFPYFPVDTKHIIQLHDSGRRYRAVAIDTAPFVDGVMCVAEHIEKKIKKELDGVAYTGLLRTVHNGASFPPWGTRVPRTTGDPFRLLFMGRLEPLKGIADIAPILRELKKRNVPALLTIVGSEDAPGEEEIIRQQIQAAGCSKMVSWKGRVPHQECYELAGASDALLMLSRKEPFGMVTIEAMSMGCIPLAYDVLSGSREILVHEKSGFLEPLGDYKSVAKRVEQLYRNPLLLEEMSASAAERARTEFNADKMAAHTASFVAEVMSKADRSSSRRKPGLPPPAGPKAAHKLKGYRSLPIGFRRRVRRLIGAHPKLCHWLLNR